MNIRTVATKPLFRFCVAVVVTQLCASAAATHMTLMDLEQMGVSIPLSMRLQTTGFDVMATAPFFLGLAVAAMASALGVLRIIPAITSATGRIAVLMVLNGTLLVAINGLVNMFAGIAVVAGFRGFGIIGLAVAGLIGAASYGFFLKR
ncbi:hypothetical protein KFE80_02285 [bacterium SCSIO 12696]|nr:hypothetical protein KFE80_02285 [bacterium SCSIO 12696]